MGICIVITWSSLQDMTLRSFSDLGTTNNLDDPEVGHHAPHVFCCMNGKATLHIYLVVYAVWSSVMLLIFCSLGMQLWMT